MRVLHLPTATGRHPIGLARAESASGVHSTSLVVGSNQFRYDADQQLDFSDETLLGRWRRRRLLLKSCADQNDVFHFNFGQTLSMTGWDLRWLRATGHRVFMTFQGDDVRPIGSYRGEPGCRVGRSRLSAFLRNRKRAWRVRQACRWCHGVFSVNPDLLEYVPRAQFVPYASVDIDQFDPVLPNTSGPIRIGHAPTTRRVKGTAQVLDAIDQASRDHDIELVLIENLPHEQAVAKLAQVDLLVDQLIVGFYGGVAVEAMAFGKPVIAFYHEPDLKYIPPAMAAELPVINATRSSIGDVLHRAVAERSTWVNRGIESRRYVQRWHNPRSIAKAMIKLYRGEAERFWDVFEHDADAAAPTAAAPLPEPKDFSLDRESV
ncbi:MAG: glycosyltransferase [Phycisphaerales bacterium]